VRPASERRRIDLTFERSGLTMTFHGWLYSLEDYGRALEDGGFVIERLREPAAPRRLVERDPRQRRWQRVPMFLWLLTRKPARSG
jgi:hypothetical protein